MNVYKSAPADVFCPDWKEPMANVCNKCAMWTAIAGRASTAGSEDVSLGWVCAKAAVFQGMVEVSHRINQLGAAMESTRNQIVSRMDTQVYLAPPGHPRIGVVK